MVEMTAQKSIKVSPRTYELLTKESQGYGDSMDDIINRLLAKKKGGGS